MDRFILPAQRTLLSGSLVSNVVALCDEANLRTVSVSAADEGVLGKTSSVELAGGSRAAVAFGDSPKVQAFPEPWRAFRRTARIRVVAAFENAGTLTATLHLSSGLAVTSPVSATKGGGWGALPLSVELNRRVDLFHDGNLELRLSWTGGGSWAGVSARESTSAFEGSFFLVPGGLVVGSVGAGSAVLASGEWLVCEETSVSVPSTDPVCVWVQRQTTASQMRAVVAGLDESTSVATRTYTDGSVQAGADFPARDVIRLWAVRP